VAVDPSFNAYLSDAEGNVLSSLDTRNLFCRDRKVVCNTELGYNGQPYETNQYLAYIAKDLFYMLSPLVNRFGTENHANQQWVVLIPKEFNVLKRELYNGAWQDHQPDSPWEEEEIEKARTCTSRKHVRHIVTSSIASFALPPARD